MATDPTITLYDISSTLTPKAWSFNTWKARFVLNYKRIPYKTIWVNFSDIKETVMALGGKPTDPNPDGGLLYTLPAIVDTSSGSPVVVTDSMAITEYLDEKYPERPVLPETTKALICTFEDTFFRTIAPSLRDLLIPAVFEVMDDRGKQYLNCTRVRWFKKDKGIEEWCPEGPAREAAWITAEQAWDKMAKILEKNGPDAKYVAGGSHPTRADFFVLSYLACIICVLPDEWNNRIRHWSGGRWERMWKLAEECTAVH